MPGSHETYLESFVEHVATLPHEVRRNMDLLKDLDHTNLSTFEEMARLQREYIDRIEDKVCGLEIVEDKVRVAGTKGEAVIPTTQELISMVEEPDTLKKIAAMEQIVLQGAEEKVTIANQTYVLANNICKRLSSDIRDMEQGLHASGDFQLPGTGKPNDLAAIQVTAGAPDWILAKVMTHDSQSGMYKLKDEDVESNKIFTLPEPQVVLLGGLKDLSRGDVVFAVYPDTTSFYQANVVQAPRKSTGGGSVVMVNFVDDSDEHGVTLDKAVMMKHIMRPPYGATLQ